MPPRHLLHDNAPSHRLGVSLVVLLGLLLTFSLGYSTNALVGASPDQASIGADALLAACCVDPSLSSRAPGASAVTLASTVSARSGTPWLLDTTGFPRRWECGTWSQALGWMHIVGDTAIWAAYMSIPVILAFFIFKRRLPLPLVTWLFIAFIASCGLGHLLEAIIFWTPLYRLAGVWKLVTATVSLMTVVALIRVVPMVLSLPSQIEQRNAAQLAQLNAKLETKNRELEQFVYTASHDLKTPLITIQGFTGMIKQDLADDRHDRLDKLTDRIQEGTNRMAANVDDLLELSRVGRVTSEVRSVDPTAMANQLIHELDSQIANAGATVTVEPDIPALICDPDRLKQALENLLINALKYGRPDDRAAEVAIRGERIGDTIQLSVCDNGNGVLPKYRQKIFGLFQRLETEVDGTGVGLAIVKRVAEVHGGRVWIEETPGGGATFVLAMPVHAVATVDEAAALAV